MFLYNIFNPSLLCKSAEDHNEVTKRTKKNIKKCLKQKIFKQYIQVEMDSVLSNSSYLGNGSLVSFQFQFPSQNRIIHEEILIFDEIGLLGSLGGALGMFLGKKQKNYRTGKAKLFHVCSINSLACIK